MALRSVKVHMIVDCEVELRFDPQEAYKAYPDSIDPLEDFARSLIEQQKLKTVVDSSKQIRLREVVVC